ncbi:hypothetical protein [Halopelagius inordinatus]|nr:hypothetical protein [Halopelagius inordinatus]
MPSGVSLSQLGLVVTLGFAWWRLVRFTRESKQEAVKQMEDQFWIHHSLDLEIPAGQTEHEREYDNKQLVVRGLEIREHGWWVQWDMFGRDEFTSRKHKLKALYRHSKAHARKTWYYIWRNIRPFAGLDLECTYLVEAQSCRIGTMEHEKEIEGLGRELSGRTITEVFDEVQSLRPIRSNPFLYRITLDTYDDYRAIEVFSEIASSKFIRDPRHAENTTSEE